MHEPVGIIAGGGQFPLLFANAAREAGRKVVIVAHEGESSPELAHAADRIHWVRLGQLGKIIKHFKKEEVREAVFLGSITKTSIFRDIRPDLRALSLWNKIDTRHDDAILRAFAGELEKEGVRILESTCYLQHLLFPRGILTQKKPSSSQREDIAFGWQMARAIGRLDIGQSVVVRDRTVVAVEAIEGTDATIRRGGKLAGNKAVVVKVMKPEQDFRFDLPAIGITTIESMLEVKASVLAVEAGRALLFDMAAVIKLANSVGIVVVGVEESAQGALLY